MAEHEDNPYWQRRLDERRKPFWKHHRWAAASPILESLNDFVARSFDDPVNDLRMRWMQVQKEVEDDHYPGLIINTHKPGQSHRFLILGDPGEADDSQYAVIDPLLSVHAMDETDFMVILSDVIYPAGDVNHYINAFYIPYKDYDKLIYAIPGNHDWYSGLDGFMYHFCSAEPQPATSFRTATLSAKAYLGSRLWLRSTRPQRGPLYSHRKLRPPWRDDPMAPPPQPTPYFAIDLGECVRLVAIDTGITGSIDEEQGEWLKRVSADNRWKILLTGKPICVDGEYDPGLIQWGGAQEERTHYVDEIISAEGSRYVAVIGGDVHNYQHYEMRFTASDRVLHYFVSGGGGAYLSATHLISRVDISSLGGGHASEEGFTCYPAREESLVLFADLMIRKLSRLTLVATALLFTIATLGAIRHFRHPQDDAAFFLATAVAVSTTSLVVAGFTLLRQSLRWKEKVPWVSLAVGAVALSAFAAAFLVGLTFDDLRRDWMAITFPIALVFVAFVTLALALFVHQYTSLGIATRKLVRLAPLWGFVAGVVLAFAGVIANDNAVLRNLAMASIADLIVGLTFVLLYVLLAVGFLRLWRWRDRHHMLDVADAKKFIQHRYFGEPTLSQMNRRALRVCEFSLPIVERQSLVHKKVSEFCDGDKPPFYKNFMLIRASEDEDESCSIRFTTFGVTGFDDPGRPAPIDEVTVHVSQPLRVM